MTPRHDDERVSTNVRVPKHLHVFRDALLQGLRALPVAPERVLNDSLRTPRKDRSQLKLNLTLEHREEIERQQRLERERRGANVPIWAIVAAALECAAHADAGQRSKAIVGSRREAKPARPIDAPKGV